MRQHIKPNHCSAGFSLIEFVIYMAVTSIVLLLVQNSVQYFKHKVVRNIQLINESLYIERGQYIVDQVFINAVRSSISTSTDGFIIDFDTYVDAKSFETRTLINLQLVCSKSDQRLRLNFVERGVTVTLVGKPYIRIDDCGINRIREVGHIAEVISSTNLQLEIKTAYSTYLHSLLNFSQFLEK